MSTTTINGATTPLNKLYFGDDYPGGSINARKTKSEEGLPELLASILDKGLIYPLLFKVAPNGKRYVGEGNRRLRALRLGVTQGRIPKDWPTRSEELPRDADAFDVSLAANIMRLPMHEVDQYEAFVQLKEGGKSVGEIASSYGTSELVVTRRLALGGLSPKLRQAWREEKIDADDAKAFTVVQDHDLQDSVYASLAQGQMLQRYSILRALTHSDGAAAVDLRFVGQDAYLAAGGRLSEDLFVDEAHVLDPEILKRLAREKVDAACRDLVAEGWGWAALAMDLPNDRYRWERVTIDVQFTEAELFRIEELKGLTAASANASPETYRASEDARREHDGIVRAARLRSITAEQKASSGCMLFVEHGGTLRIDRGIVRPGSDLGGPLPAGRTAAAAGASDGEPAAEPEAAGAEISGALAQTVSEWTTIAAANALADEPDLALRVLLAALQSYGAPARFSHAGWSGLRDAMKDKPPGRNLSFADALADTLRTGLPHLKVAIAAEVARSLDLTAAAAANQALAVRGGMPLVDALDPEGYLVAARLAFDARAFFDRAPAAVSIAAVVEMGGSKPGGKKGVVAATAADLAEKHGWLPPGMRSTAYVPPRVPAAAKAEGSTRGRRAAPAGAPASA